MIQNSNSLFHHSAGSDTSDDEAAELGLNSKRASTDELTWSRPSRPTGGNCLWTVEGGQGESAAEKNKRHRSSFRLKLGSNLGFWLLAWPVALSVWCCLWPSVGWSLASVGWCPCGPLLADVSCFPLRPVPYTFTPLRAHTFMDRPSK